MNQGDVYWYIFKEPDKQRPVLILTRDSAIGLLSALTIAPITSTIRAIPSEVIISEADGMSYDCAISLDNLQTIPKAKLGAYISHLSFEKMQAVYTALSFALGFDAYEFGV